MWLGAAAGAGYQAVYGDKDRDFSSRAAEGILGGAAIGAIVSPGQVAKGLAGTASWMGGKAAHAGLAYPGRMWRDFSKATQGGMPIWSAGLHSFGRLPVLMGAGAAIGAMVSDDHKKGALIGAGAGLAARAAIAGPRAWKQVAGTPLKKLGVIAGLSALAYAGGSAMSGDRATAEAVRSVDGGYDEEAPGTTEARSSGLKDRMAMMGATGSVVLGAHAKRHG
jgi:hypothetical protein